MLDPVTRLLDQAARLPGHPAVHDRGVDVSYADFAGLVRRYARMFAAAAQEPRVLIHLERGAHAYAAMFGALYAGGTYAPVNHEAPAARNQVILDDFEPHVVVAEALNGLVPPEGTQIVRPDALPGDGLAEPLAPADLAYVIFTSGSTGKPKGVMVPRTGLAHYVDWIGAAMAPGPADRWSQHPNIGFDLSVLDIYGALCFGATLCPLTSPKHRLLPGEAIRDLDLTIWDSVPSVIDMMVKARQLDAARAKSLRLMTFCGEALLPRHLEAIFAARPDLVVHNTYGPTEATVSCTLIRLDAANWRAATRDTVAIGDAIPGMEVHLVGGDGADEGELVLTGPQLARGYWRNAEQTARAFRDLDGRPAYHTGDWGVRRDGRVYFQARMDHQVKIRGHRVELGEIDGALAPIAPGAARTIAVEGELHCFVEAPGPLDEAGMRAALGATLPEYCVPRRFHAIARLPRNANDKIDVLALAEMALRGETETKK